MMDKKSKAPFMRIILQLLEVAISNSYILYAKETKKKITRL